ncbi:hypothetical protein LX32DRAFT_682142 [Colletotrichum zoysiae]|uniref:Tat pathway signal sequence n=1 Tax=Colletotrichum zoysiae TaxID=1216348 RepID=A0AAD9HJB5_9PEZI|nr:hypothetical protein LX32DRAFT_682142 [Colletotrichum zoysiae]
MHKAPNFGRATKTVGRMPVISEDGTTTAVTHPSPAALAPPPPCRSTAPRSYGRSPTGQSIYPHPSYPPPAYSRTPCQDSIRKALGTRSSLSTRSTHSTHSLRSVSSIDSSGSLLNSGISTPRSSYRENASLLPSTKRAGQDTPEEKTRGPKWVARRRSWCRLVILAIIALCLIVGLSVANTGCTSNSSTWRCFPGRTYSQSPKDSVATFFWTISHLNTYTYQISSSPSSNPLSLHFADETMTLVEGGSPDERLVFGFFLAKIMAVSDAATPDGRAATCTFPHTAIRATLWTRRNATAALAQSGGAAATPDSAGGNVKWGWGGLDG